MNRSVALWGTLLLASVSRGQPAPGETVLVSSNSNGVPANERGWINTCISSDGRFVLFTSVATNLVTTSNQSMEQLYRKDLLTGAVVLVSSTSAGVASSQGLRNFTMTPDARYVAFGTRARLDPADTNDDEDIYRKDLATGELVYVSKPYGSHSPNGSSGGRGIAISLDGSMVAFSSKAKWLTSDYDNNGKEDIYVRHVPLSGTVRASLTLDGKSRPNDVINPCLTANGRYVIFETDGKFLGNDSNGFTDIYQKDLQTGEVILLTRKQFALANGPSNEPCITPGGRFLAFSSLATNFVPGDGNGLRDVYLKDLRTGEFFRASNNASGFVGNNISQQPSLSGDARFVTFQSSATNLVSGDTNGYADVFVKDMLTGKVQRASVSSLGTQANQYSIYPVLSSDATTVAYASLAKNLTGDTLYQAEGFFSFAHGTGWDSGQLTTVSLYNTPLYVGKAVTLTATLKESATGMSLSGKTVRFTYDGKVFGSADTDSLGRAKLDWVVPEVESLTGHTLFVSFEGDLEYTRDGSLKVLALQKGSVRLDLADKAASPGQTFTMVAVLKNASGQPLAGREVTFYIDTSLVGASTTGADGRAQLTYALSSTAATGTYEMKAIFTRDETHTSKTAVATLTVN